MTGVGAGSAATSGVADRRATPFRMLCRQGPLTSGLNNMPSLLAEPGGGDLRPARNHTGSWSVIAA
jgi:hypothetical protein